MNATRILVVEDSEAIRLAVDAALRSGGFTVQTLPDGADLEGRLIAFQPHLVLLDLMLPGRDGVELLSVIRRSTRSAVIVLSARDGLGDRLEGLAAGADDYLVKPFAMAELIARIHAVLRRTQPEGSVTSIGDLTVNHDLTMVARAGRPLDLTDTERRLLGYLVAHRERVVTKTQILTAVWGYEGFDPNLVEVHVSALRRKLESSGEPRLVHTVRNRGYRLAATA